MSKNTFWTRRDFLKTAGIISSSAALANFIKLAPVQAATPARNFADQLLQGVSDIHIHAAPDVKARAIDELSFARDAKQAGYRSIMYKSNEWSCHDRAYLIRQALPDFEVFGSICMNSINGNRVNVHAAKLAAETTGSYCRCIWMPTYAAAYQRRCEKNPLPGIPVLGDNKKVLPEVVQVMEICAETDIIFATGHCSPLESLILAQKAQEIGLKKFVVTHANSHIWKMTYDQIKKVISLGGWVEYSFITNLWGPGTGVPMNQRLSNEDFIAYANIDPSRSFITTDLGQVNMPHPLAGMRQCIETLQRSGMTVQNIDQLVKINPAQLMKLAI